jgi:GntR family transcriptional regulator / MocR family aminotransferase
VLEIAFTPDRGGEVALVRQPTEHLAELIGGGRLAAGSKLPATREAASGLGVGRNTVGAAYAALATRGLVTAHIGQGTFVATPLPSSPAARRAAAVPCEFAWNGLFARTTPRPHLPRMFRGEVLGGPFPFDFRGGRVESDALPLPELRWAFARPFSSRARLRALAAPQHPLGWPPLRREIARLLTGRGIACAADDVAVVGGLQHAIDVTARVLVDPGDAVVLEQPGYFGAAMAFSGRGADLLGVGVDAEGIRTDQLARILRVRRLGAVIAAQLAPPRAPARLRPAAARPGSGGHRAGGRRIDGAR